MKSVAQHAEATSELARAAAWYERRESGLGDRFSAAVEDAKLFICQHPELGTPHRRGTRKWPVRKFL